MVSEILEKSWVFVNTSSREDLPNFFLEATSRQCAILSSVNPDSFASNFCYHAKYDDFQKGLKWLLKENRWCDLGIKGSKYIGSTFETNIAVDKHIEMYKFLIGNEKRIID